MQNISNLFYFGTTLYMFRTVSTSIIRSLRLYIQHQVYVMHVLWLLASKQPQNMYDMLSVTGRQHRACIIPQTVTHSLVLLKMGKIISRNMLS